MHEILPSLQMSEASRLRDALPIDGPSVGDLYKSDERSSEPTEHSPQVENFPEKRVQGFRDRILASVQISVRSGAAGFAIVQQQRIVLFVFLVAWLVTTDGSDFIQIHGVNGDD